MLVDVCWNVHMAKFSGTYAFQYMYTDVQITYLFFISIFTHVDVHTCI